MGVSAGEKRERIAIAGGTGLIGSALTIHLRSLGHEVVLLSRRDAPGGLLWDPDHGSIDARGLANCTVVINLAGANLAGGRWTEARKRELIASRTESTALLARTIAGSDPPPKLFISASAIGYYGDRGDTALEENASQGGDFLAGLARSWELAANPARAAGIPVVHPRFGIVLTPSGGALAKLLPSAKLGLGGPIGTGRQWWSWIALSDLLRMLEFLIDRNDITGAVNAVAPNPVRQREFARILGSVLHRPAFAPMPAFVMRIALGEMADAALLASSQVVPQRLLDAGFSFQHPELQEALQSMLSP